MLTVPRYKGEHYILIPNGIEKMKSANKHLKHMVSKLEVWTLLNSLIVTHWIALVILVQEVLLILHSNCMSIHVEFKIMWVTVEFPLQQKLK